MSKCVSAPTPGVGAFSYRQNARAPFPAKDPARAPRIQYPGSLFPFQESRTIGNSYIVFTHCSGRG